MKNFKLSDLAELDVEDIYDYHYEKAGEAAADRQLAYLETALLNLELMPNIGSKRPDLTDMDFLFLPVLKYFVIYKVLDDCVFIVRILGQRMDIQSLV